MSRYLPLVLTAIALAVFMSIIAKHERHIARGDDIYIKLAPTDPRSLIQGDYMRLNYEFSWAMPEQASIAQPALPDALTDIEQNSQLPVQWELEDSYFDEHRDAYQDKPHVAIWVVTDERGVVVKSAFDKRELSASELASARQLVVKNPHNYARSLYAAASSFMFAEGLAPCYEQASYAHQRIDAQGNPILIALVGDDLQSLDCEAKARSAK